jgi:hypothetical protein
VLSVVFTHRARSRFAKAVEVALKASKPAELMEVLCTSLERIRNLPDLDAYYAQWRAISFAFYG